jgi:hypothetical protein
MSSPSSLGVFAQAKAEDPLLADVVDEEELRLRFSVYSALLSKFWDTGISLTNELDLLLSTLGNDTKESTFVQQDPRPAVLHRLQDALSVFFESLPKQTETESINPT